MLVGFGVGLVGVACGIQGLEPPEVPVPVLLPQACSRPTRSPIPVDDPLGVVWGVLRLTAIWWNSSSSSRGLGGVVTVVTEVFVTVALGDNDGEMVFSDARFWHVNNKNTVICTSYMGTKLILF